MGAEVEAFLSHLAVAKRVSASSGSRCSTSRIRQPGTARSIPIAYRISVLEQREGLNWIARPLAPPVGRENKSLDSRYFFPSQREGIEGWAIARDGLSSRCEIRCPPGGDRLFPRDHPSSERDAALLHREDPSLPRIDSSIRRVPARWSCSSAGAPAAFDRCPMDEGPAPADDAGMARIGGQRVEPAYPGCNEAKCGKTPLGATVRPSGHPRATVQVFGMPWQGRRRFLIAHPSIPSRLGGEEVSAVQ